jgi:hypothetical protein
MRDDHAFQWGTCPSGGDAIHTGGKMTRIITSRDLTERAEVLEMDATALKELLSLMSVERALFRSRNAHCAASGRDAR